MRFLIRSFLMSAAVALICLYPTQTWARLPRPAESKATVLAIDPDTNSLAVKIAKDKKPIVMDWNGETKFVQDGHPSNAAALPVGACVIIYYKELSFQNPLLKKVMWETHKP